MIPKTPNNTPTDQPLTNTPQILNVLEQHLAVVPIQVPADEVMAAMQSAGAELTAAVEGQGIPLTGRFVLHHLRAPDTSFDCELCFTTPTPVQPSGRVVPGTWPAGTYARTVYGGHFSGLPAAWQEFTSWVEAQGHKPDFSAIYERYLLGPRTTPDDTQWRTELSLGLHESSAEGPPVTNQ